MVISQLLGTGSRIMTIRTTFLLIACMVLLASQALIAETVFYTLPLKDQERVRVPLLPDTTAYVEIDKGHVIVDFGKGSIQRLSNIEETIDSHIRSDVVFEDLNFDGLMDVSIPVSYGYAGAIITYDIYFFNRKHRRFENRITIMADDYQLNEKTKELMATSFYTYCCRLYTTYRFIDGLPYKYSDKISSNLCLDKVTIRNPSGKVIASGVADGYDEEIGALKPDIRRIIKNKVHLYTKPDEQTRTESYVIKGDKVRLLDLAGEWYEWVLIRYEGKKRVDRWIKLEDLDCP